MNKQDRCKCKDVEMGSYDSYIEIDIPEHMTGYALRNNLEFLCVDKCCVEDLKLLWDNKITTYGCCCGHNKVDGFINVLEFDMAISLGFEKYEFPIELGGKERRDTVKWPRKEQS